MHEKLQFVSKNGSKRAPTFIPGVDVPRVSKRLKNNGRLAEEVDGFTQLDSMVADV